MDGEGSGRRRRAGTVLGLCLLALMAPACRRAVLITWAPPTITTTTLADGLVGVAYSQTLAAAGGLAPYQWSVDVGMLPSGLTLNPATGEISGSPTAAGGPVVFTIRIRDSRVPITTSTVTLTTSILLNAASAVSITTSDVPNGAQGVHYSWPFAAQGGTGPYTWSVTSGTLPTGLTLNSTTGILSGTPSVLSGPVTFTIAAADSTLPVRVATKAFTLSILTPVPRFLYACSNGSFQTYTVHPQALNGRVRAGGILETTGFTVDAFEIAPSGRFGYGADGLTIRSFGLDTLTGAVTDTGGAGISAASTELVVHPTGNWVYASKSGVSEVAMLSADPNTGQLTSIGSVSATGTPRWLAAQPAGNFVYVSCTGTNQIVGFSVNAGTGMLTPIGTFASGGMPLRLAATDTTLYAGVGSTVEVFSINAGTGVLTPVGPTSMPEPVLRIVLDPLGRFAHVTGVSRVTVCAIHPTTGALTAGTSTIFPDSIGYAAIDPTGRYAYIATNEDELWVFQIDQTDGDILSPERVRCSSGLLGLGATLGPPVTYVPQNLYVSNGGSTSLSTFAVDPVSGVLAARPVVLLPGPQPGPPALSTDQRFLYVPLRGSDEVARLSLNPPTGAPAVLGTTPAGTGPVWTVFEPSGRFGYSVNRTAATVTFYSMNPATGALTTTGSIVTGLDPEMLVIDSLGQRSYVPNSRAGNFSQFSTGANGALLGGLPVVPGGSQPVFCLGSPAGRLLFVSSRAEGAIRVFSVTGANETLTLLQTVAWTPGVSRLAVHPGGAYLFAVNEVTNQVRVYAIDPATSVVTPSGTVSSGGTGCTGLALDADGRSLYVANTLSDTVAHFSFDAGTGQLTLVGTIAARTAPTQPVLTRFVK